MDKDNHTQLDLFSQANTASAGSRAYSSPFLEQLKNYERGILATIAVIIIGIVAFSLGVEKGKQIVSFNPAKATAPAGVKPQANPVKESRPSKAGIVPQQANSQKEENTKYKELKKNLQKYTIQLASYSARSNAQKEAETLKKRGLAAIIQPKGKYIALCVGNFPDKETAQSLLPQLKKQYRDCRIRRL